MADENRTNQNRNDDMNQGQSRRTAGQGNQGSQGQNFKGGQSGVRLGATKTGAIFMSSLRNEGPMGLVQNTHIIRGLDHGHNWTDVGPFLNPAIPYSNVPNSNDLISTSMPTSRSCDLMMRATVTRNGSALVL